MDSPTFYVVDPPDLESLFSSLRQRGHTLVGPTVRDNAVVYDVIMSAGDLPVGWGDVQEPGKYRLRRRTDKAIFGYNLGPHSWKKFLFPPALRLFAASHNKEGIVFVDGGSNGSLTQQASVGDDRPERYAFIGVRPCELSAMFVQDKVFMPGPYADPHYAALRDRAFIVAVNCSQSAETCFCTSMNAGPKAERGFDLSLTEILNDSLHYFLVEVGSKKGEDVLNDVQHRDATDAQIEEANHVVHRTAQTMKRRLDTTDIKSLVQHNLEHPRWEAVAQRCLSCANCTMVCPTCFCTTVEDTTDLTGNHAERWRKWDSCFTVDFSYIHGGSIRMSPKSRYRQWLTHKLANWIDQFGTSGCVGCGRCIAWCPVGIDITEEVRAIQESTTTTSQLIH